MGSSQAEPQTCAQPAAWIARESWGPGPHHGPSLPSVPDDSAGPGAGSGATPPRHLSRRPFWASPRSGRDDRRGLLSATATRPRLAGRPDRAALTAQESSRPSRMAAASGPDQRQLNGDWRLASTHGRFRTYLGRPPKLDVGFSSLREQDLASSGSARLLEAAVGGMMRGHGRRRNSPRTRSTTCSAATSGTPDGTRTRSTSGSGERARGTAAVTLEAAPG